MTRYPAHLMSEVSLNNLPTNKLNTELETTLGAPDAS